MPRWQQGYVSDVEYTSGFMREMTPAWLHFVALMLGNRAPDPCGRLRVADLGCGHALTAAVVAATSPEAEVWGFDFNPVHVESGRRLAALAGLDNLHVEERSFAALAEAPPGTWPEFDIVTLHGVWSWVAPESWRHVTAFLDRFLRPGGLVYVSYNTLAGWASMLPVQRLMYWAARAEAGRSDEAVQAALRFVGQLREGNALYFTQSPMAGTRLDPARTADARYLAHEYLHAHWNPVAMADVAEEMARAKCVFLGSATFPDNMVEASVPSGLVSAVNAIQDPLLKEMAIDLASARAFRRDIYRRGGGRLPPAEAQGMLERTAILGLGQPPGKELVFDCAMGQMTGKRAIYDPLLARLQDGPLTVAEARALPPFAGAPMSEVLQTFALLVSAGYAQPLLAAPTDGTAARRLNAAIARMNANGSEIAWLAAPALGSAVPADTVETLLAGELLDGAPAEPPALAVRLLRLLEASGRTVQRQGGAATDRAAAHGLLAETITATLARRVPLFRQLGVLPA